MSLFDILSGAFCTETHNEDAHVITPLGRRGAVASPYDISRSVDVPRTSRLGPEGGPPLKQHSWQEAPYMARAAPSRPVDRNYSLQERAHSMFENTPMQWLFGPSEVQPKATSMFESGAAEQARMSRAFEVAPAQNQENFFDSAYRESQPVWKARRSSGSKESLGGEDALARNEDTKIGRGFSAKMKEGIKHAERLEEENAKRTEMVPQKDGGFIANIQKGFVGLFGHLATSKEEVLRKRGPMPASEYEAVPGDDIDAKVQYLARWLPEKIAGDLTIYRCSKGQYEIGGEDVELRWHTWTRPDGEQCREVFVFRHTDKEQILSEPLPLYLQHSANVAHNLKNGHAVTQVPSEMRMSFPDQRGHRLKDADCEQRFSAMALAAEQARLRESHAVAFRNRERSSFGGESEPSVSQQTSMLSGTSDARIGERRSDQSMRSEPRPQTLAPAPVGAPGVPPSLLFAKQPLGGYFGAPHHSGPPSFNSLPQDSFRGYQQPMPVAFVR